MGLLILAECTRNVRDRNCTQQTFIAIPFSTSRFFSWFIFSVFFPLPFIPLPSSLINYGARSRELYFQRVMIMLHFVTMPFEGLQVKWSPLLASKMKYYFDRYQVKRKKPTHFPTFSISLPCVCFLRSLYYHTCTAHFTSATSGHQTCGFRVPHRGKQVFETSWVSCNLT